MGVETALFITAVGTTLSYRAQMQGLKNESTRIKEQKKISSLRALQESNLRTEQENITLSNNRTVAGAAGILDDSRSFIAIQNKVKSDAIKDIGNIRLNSQIASSNLDYASMNNKLERQSLTFGTVAQLGGYAYSAYAYNNPPTGEDTGTD